MEKILYDMEKVPLKIRLGKMRALKSQILEKYVTRPEYSSAYDTVIESIDGRIREIKKEMGAAE